MVNLKRSMAIAKKNLKIILNDRRSVGLLIFMPILMMLLFGYGFGQQIEHVQIKIINLDKGGSGMLYPNGTLIVNDTAYSDQVIDILEEDDRVDIELIEEDPEDFDIEEEKEKIYGANGYFALVVIPANFSENMIDLNKQINITVYIDGSEISSVSSIRAAIAFMVGDLMNSLSDQGSHLGIHYDYVAGDPDLRPIDTMAPGILSFAILLFMILTVTVGFTRERITGTIFRTLATPTTKGDIILGYMIGNSIIAMVQVVLLLLISVLVFNLAIVGNIFLLFLILFLYAISCVGVGIFASAFAKTQLQAFQFIPLILIPSMFFSGFLFPLNSFPAIFQNLSLFIPMTYSIRISRAISINGFGMAVFWEDFLCLVGLLFVYMLFAVIVFKKRK